MTDRIMTETEWVEAVLQNNRGKSFTFAELNISYAAYLREHDPLLKAVRDVLERVDDGARSVAGVSVTDGKTVLLKGSFLEAIERLRTALGQQAPSPPPENQQESVKCVNCGWRGARLPKGLGRPCPKCGAYAVRLSP
jgi:hypothetical protein